MRAPIGTTVRLILSVVLLLVPYTLPSLLLAEDSTTNLDTGSVDTGNTDSSTDSFEEELDGEDPMAEISDPLEPINRGVFWFNDKLDVYVAEPVSRGYKKVVPRFLRNGIRNFFRNLRYPSLLLSDLVQFKFTQAAEHTGRFLTNTTIGLGGFIDVAEDFGLPHHKEDFGIALAYHDLPPGPYLVLPIIGPSNLRDTFGLVVDTLVDPLFWALNSTDKIDKDDAFLITTGVQTIEFIDIRSRLLEAVAAGKETSTDYYLFVQGTYYQYRYALLHDKRDDDLDFDEESDEAKSDDASEERAEGAESTEAVESEETKASDDDHAEN